MSYSINWDTEKPLNPTATHSEDIVAASLKHFNDTRMLRNSVASISLGQDKLQRNIQGVAYSNVGEPLFKFNYSLIEPRICLCNYYEAPPIQQP